MKMPFVLMAILLGLLLSGGTSAPATHGATMPSVASGGAYTLTLETGCTAEVMMGNGYRLVSPAVVTASADGCCCSFIPFARH